MRIFSMPVLQGFFLRIYLSQKWTSQMTIYGYARVSTDGQTLSAQEGLLTAAGCAKVFSEKVSGATSDRPQLARLLSQVEEGETVVVCRLDRLARSVRDLLNILDRLSKAGVSFRSLSDPWADTTTPHGRLMLTVLGGLAEFERELIRARTGEGRERAKKDGVKFGRPHALTPFQRKEALARLQNGEASSTVAKTFGVHRATISRLAAN
jgi:DNA invertase Pin-like site-specific DNA recombinase